MIEGAQRLAVSGEPCGEQGADPGDGDGGLGAVVAVAAFAVASPWAS